MLCFYENCLSSCFPAFALSIQFLMKQFPSPKLSFSSFLRLFVNRTEYRTCQVYDIPKLSNAAPYSILLLYSLIMGAA